ncbi:MAG: type II toxin-antitoxin system HicA family toxin [Spirochaetia bacterium]
MPKLPIISGVQAIKAFEKSGWRYDRQKGSHVILLKPGHIASLSVPQHKELAPGARRSVCPYASQGDQVGFSARGRSFALRIALWERFASIRSCAGLKAGSSLQKR